MSKSRVSRRRLIQVAGVAGLGVAALAGCGETEIVTRDVIQVVTKEVPIERVVTQIVEKQVPVEVVKVVTREVEKIVVQEKIVTQIVEVAPAKPKTVNLTTWWYPLWAGVTGQEPESANPTQWDYAYFVIDQFKPLAPNVNIKVEEIGWNDGRQKMNVAIAAGTGPNFFHEDEAEAKKFIMWDMLESVDEYMTKEDLDDYKPTALDAATLFGKKWFFPWVVWSSTYVINKAVTDKLGVSDLLPTTEDRSWTYDQWLELALATTGTKADGEHFAYTQNFADNWGDYYRYAWLWGRGGRLFNEDYTAVTMNDEASVEGLQFLMDMQNEHNVMPPGSANFKGADVSKFWFDGLTSMADQSNGMSFQLRKRIRDGQLEPDVVDPYLVLNPVSGNNKPVHYVGTWALSAFGKNAGKPQDEIDASMEFIRFFTGPALARRPHPSQHFPTRKSAGDMYPEDPTMKFMSDVIQLQGRDTPSPWYYSMRQFFVPMWQKALTQQGTAKELLDEATKAGNEFVAKELKRFK